MLRQHPTEIESDLLARGLDIADWHRGTTTEGGWLKLSSRRLLALLDVLSADDHSAFATAMRDGDWPDETKMIASLHNSTVMFHEGQKAEEYREPVVQYLSPVERRERYEAQLAEAEDDADALDNVFDQIGFS